MATQDTAPRPRILLTKSFIDSHDRAIKTIAMSRSWQMRARKRNSSRSVVTSSAVVGSSQMMRSGLFNSAIAIATRWRMPPENWCG